MKIIRAFKLSDVVLIMQIHVTIKCQQLLTSGKNRNLLTIDKKLIQLRLGQSKGDETQSVYHEVLDNTSGCTVFDSVVYGDTVYLCVGKTDKITIMKYNTSLRKFCIRKVHKSKFMLAFLSAADFFQN